MNELYELCLNKTFLNLSLIYCFYLFIFCLRRWICSLLRCEAVTWRVKHPSRSGARYGTVWHVSEAWHVNAVPFPSCPLRFPFGFFGFLPVSLILILLFSSGTFLQDRFLSTRASSISKPWRPLWVEERTQQHVPKDQGQSSTTIIRRAFHGTNTTTEMQTLETCILADSLPSYLLWSLQNGRMDADGDCCIAVWRQGIRGSATA